MKKENIFVMGVNLMNLHASRLRLFKEVQEEFNRVYPFLKIEFPQYQDEHWISEVFPTDDPHIQAVDFLNKDIGLSNDMTVADLETSLGEWFGRPVQVLRKNGHSWMEVRMTRDWSLKKQNEQGRAIAVGFQ